MSFDLTLQKFVSGEEVPTCCRPVIDVLNSRKHRSGTDGWHVIEAENGNEFEFRADGLNDGEHFSGAQFRLFGLTISVAQFVYQVANAGGMVIFNAQADVPEEPMMILPESASVGDLDNELVDQLGQPALVTSGEELYLLLTGSASSWEKFRGRVTGAP